MSQDFLDNQYFLYKMVNQNIMRSQVKVSLPFQSTYLPRQKRKMDKKNKDKLSIKQRKTDKETNKQADKQANRLTEKPK